MSQGELMTDLDLLVELVPGGEAQVIAVGGRPREFRRISSVLRGKEKALVEDLIAEVEREEQPAARGGAEGLVLAAPVFGPDSRVVAVQIVSGDQAAAPVAAAVWELIEDGAPRLHPTPELLDLLDIPAVERDRYVYGPLDFFHRIARISDLVRLWENLLNATPDTPISGSVIIRKTDGTPGVLLYAQRYFDTAVGPRVRMIFQDATATADPTELAFELLDVSVAAGFAAGSGMFGAVLDVRWPTTCILKWLTQYPSWFGHGVAMGQAPGMHPEDIMRVPSIVAEALKTGEVHDSIRSRRGALSEEWTRTRFIARAVDANLSRTLGLALVYPTPEEA